MRKMKRYFPAILILVGLVLGGCAWLLRPLEAKLTANPTSGPAPLSVTFSAAGSTGAIVSFTLDFGDGSEPYSGTDLTVSISHTYNNPGTYTATLTVSDAQGRTAQASVTITVTAPPVASVSLGAFPASGHAPLLVGFWAQVEAAPGTRIKHVALDVDTDGTPELDSDVDFTSFNWWIYEHEYTDPGVYTATLTVTDDSTPPKSYSATVTVTVTSAPPVITEFKAEHDGDTAYEGDTLSIVSGDTVTFSFTADAANPQKIKKWSLACPGSNVPVQTVEISPIDPLTVTGLARIYSHDKVQTQTFTATLTVWDDLDNSDTAEITIEVAPAAP